MIKNPSAMQEPKEMLIQSPGPEDPLEQGSPLQYSYLENPMDRGDWWATVHGVAKSQTGLSIKTIEYSSLCYSVGPYLSILYIIVCICLKAL